MSDSELKEKLATWKLPSANAQAQSRAKWHALTAFRNRTAEQANPTATRACRVSWSILAGIGAVAGLVLAAFFWLQPTAGLPLQNPSPLLSELEQFFQGRLAAVVQQDGEINLRLLDVPVDREPDQRVAVRLEWPGESIEILTYSGVAVCVDSPDGMLCLTPLITGSGNVLVISDTGLLKNKTGFRTKAHLL